MICPSSPCLLFDANLYRLDYAKRRDATVIDDKDRATLEVRLRAPRGPDLHVFVVHLKAGGGERDHEKRQKQLERLAELVVASTHSRERVLVLGDFNTTRAEDRAALEDFAASTGLHWTTRELGCTAFWQPKGDRWCEASALDHVFSSRPARDVAARGLCESLGCGGSLQCPIVYRDVSDHCPVTARF